MAVLLTSGLTAVVSNDVSVRTRNRLQIINYNALIGFVLMLGALLVFMNFKTALVTSMSVPVVILSTLIAMNWLGITFNLVSMLAVVIELGMFVDNSIVISKNIFHQSQEEKT